MLRRASNDRAHLYRECYGCLDRRGCASTSQTHVDAADGWMITLDSKEESSLLILHDLSDLNSQIEVVQPILDDNSTYSIQENHILMSNETEMMLVDISNPSIPLFTKQVSNPQQIGFVSDEKIVILQDGVISYFDYAGNLSDGVQPSVTESILQWRHEQD